MANKIAICLWGDAPENGMDQFNTNVIASLSKIYSIDLFVATYNSDSNYREAILKNYKAHSVTFMNREAGVVEDKSALMRASLSSAAVVMRNNNVTYCFIMVLKMAIMWLKPLSILKPSVDKFNVLYTLNSTQLSTDLWIINRKTLPLLIRILDDNSSYAVEDLRVHIERVVGIANPLIQDNSEIGSMLSLKVSIPMSMITGRTVIGIWGKMPETGLPNSLKDTMAIYKRRPATDRIMMTNRSPWINSILLHYMPSKYGFMTDGESDIDALKKLLAMIAARNNQDTVVLLHASFNPVTPIDQWEVTGRTIMQYADGDNCAIILPKAQIDEFEKLVTSTGAFPAQNDLAKLAPVIHIPESTRKN